MVLGIDRKTTLIILRGPSGAGKSSVAKAIRDTWGKPMAWVEQDHLRRIVLKEKDIPNGKNIGLIKQTTLYALEQSVDVVLEGILDAGRYQEMLKELIETHQGRTFCFYFNIPLEETLRRHECKPNKTDFGEEQMRAWYKEKDLLQITNEEQISATNSLEETVMHILSVCRNH